MTQKTHKQEAIIRPVRSKRDPVIGPDALMAVTLGMLKYLVHTSSAREIPFTNMNSYHLYQVDDSNTGPVTISGPFLGAPHAVIGMEKLIVMGAKRIWVLGFCGSLQPGLLTGDLLIPTTAVSEEGTSAHYPIPGHGIVSDPGMNRLLEDALKEQDLHFSKGPVWTTDALYRETKEKVTAYRDMGILAVEMELSALMTLAIFRSVKMAGVLAVSDELYDMVWRPGFSSPLLKKNSRAACRVMLNLARTLSKKESDISG